MDLLKVISNSVKLITNINNLDKTIIQTSSGYKSIHLGNISEINDVVCFCDIPQSHIEVHTEKHSKFGVSFNINFNASRGGRPVTYIPTNSNID